MPIFEFRCLQCGEVFEKLFYNSGEEAEMVCPHCKSESFERVVSSSSYVMGSGPDAPKTKVTSKSCGSGNNCMTLDIPGPAK